MSTFRLHENGIIYLYHWLTPTKPFKVSTGLKIEKSKWSPEKKRPKSANFKYKGKNVTRELIRHEEALHEALNYYETNAGFSTMKLKERYKNNFASDNIHQLKENNSSFINFFSSQVEEYKSTQKSNWKIYNTTLNHLKKYFGKSQPEFEDIDTSFFLDYNKYLLKEGLSKNTIANHWKNIKAIMRHAHYQKLHHNTDYQFFKVNNEKADTIYLTEEDLQKIFDLDIKGYLDKARDYFLIGCYSGLRYEDWDQLTKAKIKNGMATIINTKTGEKSIIPIANNVTRILQKYPDGILPPKPSNQKMNKYIKEVAEIAKINEPVQTRITKGGKMVIESKPKFKFISTHTARRSFATIMILNGVPSHIIMRITAHRSAASFERYIRFDELQAGIQLKETDSFKKSFGKALTWSEKLQYDDEFRNERLVILT